MALQHTRLKGITHVGKDSITQNLKYSLIDFFRWSILGIGGFQNITTSPATSGVYGGDRAALRSVTDPNYTDGQVWEGFRSDWVWETGIPTDNVSEQPIRVSGIYVGGVLNKVAPYKNDGLVSGSVGYVDYNKGRVVLDSAISTTSTVTCEFSHRYVSFISSDTPWFQQLMFDSYRIERDFPQTGSGNYAQLSETRRHMPVVAIEIVPRRDFSGYQLGGGQWLRQDVLFHIIAEREFDRDQLIDIVSFQNDKTLFLYDKNLIYESTSFPVDLDYRGSPVPSAIMYPNIVAATGTNIADYGHGGFRYKKVRLMDTAVYQMGQIHPTLFGATIKTTAEVVMGEI